MAEQEDGIMLPQQPGRESPIYKPAKSPCNVREHAAVFIFLHGLADSAAAIQSRYNKMPGKQFVIDKHKDVADQFQQGGKLPWMSWVLPNAKFNRDAMDTAWFIPNPLPSLAPSRPELAPDDDEEGMLQTVAYLETLIDACVDSGIPTNRIILGGFSQGCAMSLLTHLVSTKYSGRLAGVVGLLGFLPLSDGKQRIQELREENGLSRLAGDGVPLFLARGTVDPLIPKRVWNYTLQGLADLGFKDGTIDVHEYEGLAHTINGPLLRDLCVWLEKVVPSIEA